MQFFKFFSSILYLIGAIVVLTRASYAPGTVLKIELPSIEIQQFRYEPKREGYVFSYTLSNGVRREESGILLHGGTSQQDLVAANDYARNDRPTRRPGVKNRKLSPKSLQSLAG